MRHKWFRSLVFRRVLIGALIVLQLACVVYFLLSSSVTSSVIAKTLTGISLLVCLHIISKERSSSYKLTWIAMVLLFPIFGGSFYLYFNFQTSIKRFFKKSAKIEQKARPMYAKYDDAYVCACKDVPHCTTQIRYLQDTAGFPVYADSQTTYLESGEKMWECLLDELKKAEHYIFLEYFLVQEGTMWNAVLAVLKEKAAAGVEVRVIYDDFGCFFLLPKDYPKQLQTDRIQCRVFNPFRPFLTTKQNNRDHRKIAVIDGKKAFTGGVNLADEYINAVEKYGHWKDSVVMIKGKAAWSLTVMFLQMWELCGGKEESYDQYAPKQHLSITQADGYVQPYADSPLDRERVGEEVYLQMIYQAKDYIYIHTPYLIISDRMMDALCHAAKSGVDVRIITPHKWDKWIIHMMTRSYYRQLLEAGVQVYEYSKGFVHSKTVVSDDTVATIGTINFDFRSLYLHFECGTVLYNSQTVLEVKRDFLTTLSCCQVITEQDCKENLLVRLFQDVMRIFAPLM